VRPAFFARKAGHINRARAPGEMRAVAACLFLAPWLLAPCEIGAQPAPTPGANASNATRVNFTVFGAGANVSAGQIAGQLNADGWSLTVLDSSVSNNPAIAPSPAGNRTRVNCTLTPNATDCQAEDSGLAWWVILLIVFFSVAGAAGLGVLIWYLYSTYTPRTAGYAPVYAPGQAGDPKVIPVALVSLVHPAARET